MLLSNGPLGLKLIGLTVFLISSFAFLNYHAWSPRTWAWDSPPPPPPPPPPSKETITLTVTSTERTTTTATQLSISTLLSTQTITLQPSQAALSPASPSSNDFPQKIWYKLGPKGQSNDSKSWASTCHTLNPSHRIEYLTDASALTYVNTTFSPTRPDIVAAYSSIPIPILRADMLRYLLLYSEGGVWSDLDVSCESTPFSDWIPKEMRQKEINLVVGVEFDVGLDYPFERQFATWTVLAKPRSPHLIKVVDDILLSLTEVTKKHNTTLSELTMEMIDDVVYFTGPRRFSRSVSRSLASTLNTKVESANYSMVMEPRLMGDVLVLPGWALAGSVNKDWPEGKEGKALVKHHYAGSWKNKEGGEGGA